MLAGILRKIKDPVSALTHYAGAAAALPGVVVLLGLSPGMAPAGKAALLVYGASLFLLFFSSGLYHTLGQPPRAAQLLRKLDHACIYILIAGSYTPFCVIAFEGPWRWPFLAVIWSLAAAGVVAKLFYINAPRWITAGAYVLMGWLSVLAVREILTSLPPASVAWLVTGGLAYTVGAVVYVTKRLDFLPGRFGFHEVWHLFVLAGAAAHFVSILLLIQAG